MWRKVNPTVLLVGLQTGTATTGEQCGDSLTTQE